MIVVMLTPQFFKAKIYIYRHWWEKSEEKGLVGIFFISTDPL